MMVSYGEKQRIQMPPVFDNFQMQMRTGACARIANPCDYIANAYRLPHGYINN
jgi:hypothetical protein